MKQVSCLGNQDLLENCVLAFESSLIASENVISVKG
jgi:hypothetical protein